jgi:hypothetical protein
MRQHLKHFALSIGLAFSCIVAVLIATPFYATPAAQSISRMVSPQFPILLDNGNGVPDPGDTSLLPTQAGPTAVRLPSTFSCGTQPNLAVSLGSADGSGRFRSASRLNNGRTQEINVTGAAGSTATQFSFTESDGRVVRSSGNGTLVDSNGDGAMDGMSISGGRGSALVSMVFTPDSSYVSIPVGQSILLGFRQGRCGPGVAQVWVPLADTNGDGRGDSVVVDLDGNGIPDPQYYTSPRLGAQGVPTTNSIGLAILTLLLGAFGVWYLGQRQIDNAGTV